MRNVFKIFFLSLALITSGCTGGGSEGGAALASKNLVPPAESEIGDEELEPAMFLIRVRAMGPGTDITFNSNTIVNKAMDGEDISTSQQGAFVVNGWQNILAGYGYTFEGYITHVSAWDPLEIELYVNDELVESAVIDGLGEIHTFQNIDIRTQ